MTSESEEYARLMGEYFRNKEQGIDTPMPEYSGRLTPDHLKDSERPLPARKPGNKPKQRLRLKKPKPNQSFWRNNRSGSKVHANASLTASISA